MAYIHVWSVIAGVCHTHTAQSPHVPPVVLILHRPQSTPPTRDGMANYEVAVKGGSSDIHIRVFSTFTDALTPVPTEIGQLDNQLVQFLDSHTVPSKYPTDTQVGRCRGLGSPTNRLDSFRINRQFCRRQEIAQHHRQTTNRNRNRNRIPDDAPAAERAERGEFHEEEPLRVPGQGPGLGPLQGRAGGQRVSCGLKGVYVYVLTCVVSRPITNRIDGYAHKHHAGPSPRSWCTTRTMRPSPRPSWPSGA